MQDLRQFIRLLLLEDASIPGELTGKKNGQPAFVFGKKSKEYLSGILNTNSSHRVATERAPAALAPDRGLSYPRRDGARAANQH